MHQKIYFQCTFEWQISKYHGVQTGTRHCTVYMAKMYRGVSTSFTCSLWKFLRKDKIIRSWWFSRTVSNIFLLITNLTHFFMYLFISSLYMFQASQCSSSGDQTVLIHHLVWLVCVSDCLVCQSSAYQAVTYMD